LPRLLLEKVPSALRHTPSPLLLDIDNLIRLRLIAFPSIGFDFIENKEALFQLSNSDLLCGTHMGHAFIQVCRVRGDVPETSDVPVGSQQNPQQKGVDCPYE
jgi:hypothetical protein